MTHLMPFLLLLYTLVLLFSNLSQAQRLRLLEDRAAHKPQELSGADISYLSNLSDVSHFNNTLEEILIERPVGSEGHEKVYRYITDQLTGLGWTVETDEFSEEVPLKDLGVLTFKNIVATLNPNADRFLVLACHYDSKYYPHVKFVGATDSAVPCAMLLNIAHVLKDEFEQVKANTDLSLQLIFFDGEEAFKRWSARDSIYGARHLAKRWHRTHSLTRSGEMVSNLNRIDLFILLDLIGTKDVKFYNFFDDTVKWYLRLVSAEDGLDRMSLLTRGNSRSAYFTKQQTYSAIEDDHIPFLKKSVPVLHMIPVPFPAVWHTPADDQSAIHFDTVEDLNKILRVFVAEYLHLQVK